MRLLLDTHVLLWWLADSPRLTRTHRTLIADGAHMALVSTISLAEISIKASLGKLEAPDNLADAVRASGFELLDFGPAAAEALRDLPWHHRDPFDRMLICQALADGLTLLTINPRIQDYAVHTA